jgi:hypothetical protein
MNIQANGLLKRATQGERQGQSDIAQPHNTDITHLDETAAIHVLQRIPKVHSEIAAFGERYRFADANQLNHL